VGPRPGRTYAGPAKPPAMRKTDRFAVSPYDAGLDKHFLGCRTGAPVPVRIGPTKEAYNFARSLSIAARGADYLELLC
jgi:hypothetical protein